jgi:hypothetical protein
MPGQDPPLGPQQQPVQGHAHDPRPHRRGENQVDVASGVRVRDEGTYSVAVDGAGDDSRCDADDDRNRRRHPDPGRNERGSGGQADAADHGQPPKAERAQRVLGQRVDVAKSVDRVEQHRPDGSKDDQRDVHLQARAEHEGSERDQRDRRDRPQELDDDAGGAAHAGHAAEHQAERHSRGHGDGQPQCPGLERGGKAGEKLRVAHQDDGLAQHGRDRRQGSPVDHVRSAERLGDQQQRRDA